MATEGQYLSFNHTAGEDLDSHQHQAIALDDGKVANNGAEAVGILMNKPKNGEGARVGFVGEMKFRAGGAITKDGPITVATSGYFTAAGSGDYIVGRAKAAVSSGSIGTGFFSFAKPAYANTSDFAW